MKNFIIFDSISSPLETKNAFLKLLRKDNNLYVFNSRNFYDGKGIYKLRELLNSIDKENTISFIWNGSELGCEIIKRNLEQFNIKYVYFEQGLLPQHETLRLINNPIFDEINLGINIHNVKNLEYTINNKINFSNAVCVVFQLSYDSSLLKIKNPLLELPKLYNDVINKHFKNYKVILCPHPKDRNNINLYNLKAFDNKYEISKKNSIEEVIDSGNIITFNSTISYESYLYGANIVVLDNKHLFNSDYVLNKNFVYSCIKHCQFDPNKININELLYKVYKI